MQCENRQSMLDDYLDGTLEATVRDELVGHIGICTRCQQELGALEVIRGALRALPVMPARENFASEAIALAAEKGQPDSKKAPGFMHWFGAGFAGALAAGLAIWGFTLTFQLWQPQAPKAKFSIALYQPRKISLAFNAPTDVKNVTVSIELPAQFELVGHAGRQKLSWKTSLKKGRNILTLPVVARSEGEGTMIARLSRYKQVKTIEILLATDKPDLSHYRVTSEIAV